MRKRISRGMNRSTPTENGKSGTEGNDVVEVDAAAITTERMLRESGLGRYRACTLDNFEPLPGKKGAHGSAKAFVRKVARWWKQGNLIWDLPGLFLYGPTGTGKSHLAAAVCVELIEQHGVYSMFLPSVRVPRNDQDELLRLSDPDEVPVLALDDLGAEKATPRFLECVQAIVEGRIHSGAPTVVTSNFDPNALRARLDAADAGVGDRIASRLVGPEYVVAPVGGRDMRTGRRSE